jgi:hypothetical protein
MEEESELPPLSSPFALSPAQVAQFGCDGHICLRGVCTPPEIEVYRRLIAETAEEGWARDGQVLEPDKCNESMAESPQPAYLKARLAAAAPGIRQFVRAPRFAGIAAQLTGAAAVRLFHEMALFKPPGGIETPYHQDQYYWPLDTRRAVGMWMALADVTEDMGPIRYRSGSHLEGYLGLTDGSLTAHGHTALGSPARPSARPSRSDRTVNYCLLTWLLLCLNVFGVCIPGIGIGSGAC